MLLIFFHQDNLGVAIGSAKNKKGLRIIGFRASQLLSVSPEVTNFYERTPTEFTDTFADNIAARVSGLGSLFINSLGKVGLTTSE